MVSWKKVLLGGGAVSVAAWLPIHLLASSKAKKIQALPDTYPYEVLKRDPEGEQSFVEREDGTRLRAIVHEGDDGPPVVFVHGYGASLACWNVIWGALQSEGKHRLIAFDHRGHCQSTIGSDGVGTLQMVGDLRAILEHFDASNAILVGHSMGGFLSMAFMLHHPDVASARLRHCVLMSTLAGNALKGAPQNRLQVPLLKRGVIKKVAGHPVYSWLLGASFYGDHPLPAGIRVSNEELLEQDHTSILPILDALIGEDYYDQLHEISTPCTVVYGLKDKTTPAHHSENIARNIPNAQTVTVPGAGHALNWEAPSAILDSIREAAR